MVERDQGDRGMDWRHTPATKKTREFDTLQSLHGPIKDYRQHSNPPKYKPDLLITHTRAEWERISPASRPKTQHTRHTSFFLLDRQANKEVLGLPCFTQTSAARAATAGRYL